MIGAPVGLVAFFANEVFGWFSLQFLYAAGIMLAVSATLFIGISLASEAPPRERIAPLMWRPRDWHEDSQALRGVPFWKSFRAQALVLALATLTMVWIFR